MVCPRGGSREGWAWRDDGVEEGISFLRKGKRGGGDCGRLEAAVDRLIDHPWADARSG